MGQCNVGSTVLQCDTWKLNTLSCTISKRLSNSLEVGSALLERTLESGWSSLAACSWKHCWSVLKPEWKCQRRRGSKAVFLLLKASIQVWRMFIVWPMDWSYSLSHVTAWVNRACITMGGSMTIYISHLLVFGVDGRIICCVVNAPGSVHDSTLAFWGKVYLKLEATYKEPAGLAASILPVPLARRPLIWSSPLMILVRLSQLLRWFKGLLKGKSGTRQ